PAYAAIDPPNPAVSNTDNDTAGITVTPITGLTTTEAGGQATFTVVLTSQPTAEVRINVASTNPAEGTVSASQLTFTTANWGGTQTVTITWVNDFVADVSIPYRVNLSTSCSDPAYAAIDPPNPAVQNTDNDSAGITVTP